jgi:MFS family permease
MDGGIHSLDRTEAVTLLKNRPFCRLWAAQFSTVTVTYGLSLAGAVLVEGQTQSSAQTGLVILSAILPAFLASLVSGAVVDRWGRVRVLIVSHLSRVLAGLVFWGGTQLLPPGPARTTIYAINVTGAVFGQFAMPAELALLPDLVGQARLVSANALLGLGMLVGEGLGIVVLSPLVIKAAGAPVMGLVGAGLCLLALVLVLSLPRDPGPLGRVAKDRSVLAGLGEDLQAGWRVIAKDRLLRLVAIQATLAATLLLVLLSLVPGLASRHLGVGVEDAPLLILPGGIGFAFGALLVGRWEGRLSRLAWIAFGLTGLGASVVLLALFSAPHAALWLVVGLIFVLGVTLALVIVPSRTVLQERPPAEMRGRVIASQLALANAAAVLPILMGGALADHLGIRPVMGILGLVALGAGAAGIRHVAQ